MRGRGAVPEEGHCAVQFVLELLVGRPLVAGAQLAVDVPRDELGRLVLPRVDEALEPLLQRVREELVRLEGAAVHRVEPRLEPQQLGDQILLALDIADHLGAHLLHVLRPRRPQRRRVRADEREEVVHPLEVVDARGVHQRDKPLLEDRVDVGGEKRRHRRLPQRPPRRRLQIVLHARLLRRQPAVDVAEVRRHVGGGEPRLRLGGVVPRRRVDKPPLELGGVEAEVVVHPQQRVEEAALDLVAVPLLLDQQEQPRHRLRHHLGPALEVGAEELEPHVPKRLLRRRLHHVRAVEVEEDGADRQHLLAVVAPAPVDEREERLRVGRLVLHQRGEPRVDVRLALALQPLVRARRHAVEAEVLHRAVQLLEAVPHRLLRVHRAHRRLQLRPRVVLKVLRQLRLRLERLDDELARRRRARGGGGGNHGGGNQGGGGEAAIKTAICANLAVARPAAALVALEPASDGRSRGSR